LLWAALKQGHAAATRDGGAAAAANCERMLLLVVVRKAGGRRRGDVLVVDVLADGPNHADDLGFCEWRRLTNVFILVVIIIIIAGSLSS